MPKQAAVSRSKKDSKHRKSAGTRQSSRKPKPRDWFQKDVQVGRGVIEFQRDEVRGLDQPGGASKPDKDDPFKVGSDVWVYVLRYNGWKSVKKASSEDGYVFYAPGANPGTAEEGVTKYSGYKSVGVHFLQDGDDGEKMIQRALDAVDKALADEPEAPLPPAPVVSGGLVPEPDGAPMNAPAETTMDPPPAASNATVAAAVPAAAVPATATNAANDEENAPVKTNKSFMERVHDLELALDGKIFADQLALLPRVCRLETSVFNEEKTGPHLKTRLEALEELFS